MFRVQEFMVPRSRFRVQGSRFGASRCAVPVQANREAGTVNCEHRTMNSEL